MIVKVECKLCNDEIEVEYKRGYVWVCGGCGIFLDEEDFD